MTYYPDIPRLQKLPALSKLPTINTQVKMPSLPDLPTLPNIKKWMPSQQDNLISNYNDPYAVNSMADVISASFNDSMNGTRWVKDGPAQLLNIIPNAWNMVRDTTLRPISQGEFGKAAINNLMAFSETLDIFANPVKGYLMEGEEGFRNGLGFSDYGRQNYDWDTGNLLSDIGMEVVSDPMNWLTLFTKPIVSGLTKTAVKGVLKEGGMKASSKLDEVVSYAVKSYMRSDKLELEKSLVNVASMMGQKADSNFMNSFQTAMEYMTDNAGTLTNLRVLKGISSMVKTADKVDDTLLKASLRTTPALGLPWLAKKGLNPITEFTHERGLKLAKVYNSPLGVLDIMKLDDFDKAFDKGAIDFNRIVDYVGTDSKLDSQLKNTFIEGSLKYEVNLITQMLKEVNAEKYPDIIPEEKIKKVTNFLDRHFEGNYQMFVDVLHQYNLENTGKYEWFEDYLGKMLNIEAQQTMYDQAQVSKIWDFIKDNIFTAKDVELKVKYQLLEDFIKDTHKVSMKDFLDKFSQVNLKYQGKFQGLEDTIRNLIGEYQGQAKFKDEIVRQQQLTKVSDYMIQDIPVLQDVVTEIYKVGEDFANISKFLSRVPHTEDGFKQAETALNFIVTRAEETLKSIPVNLMKTRSYETIVKEISKKIQDMREVLLKAFKENKLTGSKKQVNQIGMALDDTIAKAIDMLDEDLKIYKADTTDDFSQNIKQSIEDTADVFQGNYEDVLELTKNRFKQLKSSDVVTKDIDIEQRVELQIAISNFFAREDLLTKHINVPAGYDTSFNPDTKIKKVKGVKPDKEIDIHSEEYRNKVLADYNYRNGMIHPVDMETIMQSDRSLMTGDFMSLTEDWILQNARDLNISDEGFKNKLIEFYYAPVEDIETFSDAVNNLAWTVSFLSQQSDKAKAILSDLTSVLDNFQTEYSKSIHSFMDIQKDAVYYKFQLEKAWVTEQSLADEKLNEIIDEFTNPNTPAYNIINNLALDGNEEAIHAMEGIEHFQNYKDFRIGLAAANIDADTKMAFLSTIQKFARADARVVAENADSYVWAILKETETHYNSIMMDEKLTVGDLYERYVKDKAVDLQKHTAESDVKMLKAITDELLQKELPDADHYTKVFFDIETTDLNKNIGDVIQYSAYVDETNKLTRNIQSDVIPAVSTIKALNSDLLNTNSFNGLIDYFKQTYQTDVKSEDVAFLELVGFLENIVTNGKQVRLVIHNGNSFDVPFLKEKLKRIVDESYRHWIDGLIDKTQLENIKQLYIKGASILEEVKVVDTYQLIAKQKGYKTITGEAKGQLTELVKQLAKRQAVFKYNKPTYNPYLIQPMNSSVGKMMNEIGLLIQSEVKDGKLNLPNSRIKSIANSEAGKHFKNLSEFAKQLRVNGGYVQEFFKTVSSVNKKLGLDYFDKSLFDWEIFQQEFGLHLSQKLYSKYDVATGERSFIAGIRHYGYKKGIDTQAVKEFFDLDVNREYPMAVLDQYSRYSKYVQDYVRSIKGGALLKEREHDINLVTGLMLKELKQMPNVPEYLRALKVHHSYIYNYAIMQFVYNRPETILEGFWKEFLAKGYSDAPDYFDVIKFVAEPKRYIKQTNYTIDTISFLEEAPSQIKLHRETLKEVSDIRKQITKDFQSKKFYRMDYTEAVTYFKNQIDNLSSVKYSEYFTEFREYIRVYQNAIDIFESKKSQLVPNALEKIAKKIETLQAQGQMQDIEKSLNEAVVNTSDHVNYLKNVARSLDNNKVQSAYVQKKAASLNKIYNTLSQYRTLILNEPTFEGRQRIISNMNRITDRIALLELKQVTELTDDVLFNYLATSGKRIMTFNSDELSPEDLVKFMDRQKLLETKGIHIEVEDKQIYVVLGSEAKLTYLDGKIYYGDSEIIKPELLDYDVNSLLDGMKFTDEELNFYRVDFKSSREQLINLSEGKVVGGLGEIANQKYYQALYDKLPKAVKILLPNVDELVNKNTVPSINFNHSVLGTTRYRRDIAGALPSDALSIYANSGVYASKYSSTQTEYLQLYYDDIYSINVGMMKDMSDEELFQALNVAPEFTLSFLKEVDGKPMPQIIKLTSVQAIKEARRLGAVVLPTQTYNKAFSTIQSFNWSETAFNTWHKIIYMYKTGFLANAGVVFRNIIDSTMKNMISTGDPLGVLQSYGEGLKTYKDYRETIREVMAMDEKGRLLGKNIDFYFQNMNPAMPQDYFKLIHGFMEDGPSAGEVPELAKYYKSQRKAESTMWDKYVQASSYLLSANNEIEHIARLSEYLWAIRHGQSNTEAYRLVTKTHFDYGLKTKQQLMTELVFPFYTFKMRNMEYWIEAVDKDPWLASLFRDILTPVWNFDDYDEYELERNRSLHYQILSGNVPLQRIFSELPEELTLKLNPSFMDTYNTITDPLGTMQSSLAPPAKFLANMAKTGLDDGWLSQTLGQGQDTSFFGTGYDESVISMIPVAGALYQKMQLNKKYEERTDMGMFQAPGVSGIFGATDRYDPYQPKRYAPYAGYKKSPKLRKPKKAKTWVWKTWAKKAYPKQSYHKNTYHRRMYADRTYGAFKDVAKGSGLNRFKNRLVPTTTYSMKYQLKLLKDYL